MTITAEMIKSLRERTNAPMTDCKKALVEADGDDAKAIEILRKKGAADVAQRGGRIAAEGFIGSYIHDGRVGVLVEVNCETDFVARTEAFQNLCKEVAMQIAATPPRWVSPEDISEEDHAQEESILRARILEMGRPEKILPMILDGMTQTWYKDVCLLNQTYNRDKGKTIADLVNEVAVASGEKIVVRRFVRFELGEGLAKRVHDLEAEVQEMLG